MLWMLENLDRVHWTIGVEKNASIISKKKGQVIAVKLLAHAYEPEEMLYFHNARSL